MKVLIVGFGSIARKHYQALLQIDPSANIIALRSNALSEPIMDVVSIYTVEEIMQNAPYDFAIISNPTYKHEETIERLLDLNCPLFIEKPLFHTIESKKVLKKITKKGIKTYVACNLRFLESLIYLKETLLPVIIPNEVNVYCGSFLPEWRLGVNLKSMYSAHASKGGGVHLDLIHELDYIYWLFGKPVQVHSVKRSKSTLNINAIDYANYLLEYDKFAVNIVLNYYRRDKKRTIELVCSDDTYSIDLFSNNITSTNKTLFQSEQVIMDTYKIQLEYFINKAVKSKGDENIMNTVYEAFEVLKICLN
jgi:predicted dehydrogenase